MDKVIGGTPNHQESRCVTCRWAQIVRSLADSSERVYCRAIGGNARAIVMQQPIIDCNTYDDKRIPSRWDMEQIAWVLITNKAGKSIGFVSAEEFKRSQIPPPQVGF